MLVRVAVATKSDVVELLRAPYARTLWTYCHLLQAERADEINRRSQTLYAASLTAMAYHDPKRLNDEHRRLLRDAGQFAAEDTARAEALALVAAVARVDAASAWQGGTP